ncbi:hypothetical protein DFQ66_07090 [Salmonella enterica subsp. enterica serovar Amager]|nr:hypothetical protein [Salmonella enterica subsp. enterica serovar Amager]
MTEVKIDHELARADILLTAALELYYGNERDREISYDILERLLTRLREIQSDYVEGVLHAD